MHVKPGLGIHSQTRFSEIIEAAVGIGLNLSI